MREAEKKRLIELIKQGDKAFADKYTGEVMSHIDELYEFIADHLLANGAIVPPCKVGDVAYRIYTNSWIGEDKVCEFIRTENALCYVDDKGRQTSCDVFGKTVFLSEAEAKYALKNRRSVSLVNGHIEE